jgi:hypothetical protein
MSSRGIRIQAATVDSRNQGECAKAMLVFGDGIDKNAATVNDNIGF